MGANDFFQMGKGGDVKTSFVSARDEALYDHGHSGYTGTLAEKDSFVVIDDQPKTRDQAYELARALIEDSDDRIDDKWGPAGAIRVKDEKDDGWLFFGWASS